MLNFKEFLNESQDQPYPFTVDYRTDHTHKYSFKTENGRPGFVIFYAPLARYEYEKPPFPWIVEFAVSESTSVTGEGDAFRIFATVIEAMKHFYTHEREMISGIEFSALRDKGKKSRIKLYRRMLDKFARQYQYEVLETNEGSKVVFILYNLRDDYA